MLKALATAKINLYLHVTGRNDAGYHLLDSMVVFGDYGDKIFIDASDELSLNIKGNFADNMPYNDDNLVIKAAKLLANHAGIKPQAAITLYKNLPIASGIGGGSADAATTIKLLNKLWNLNYSNQQLADIALQLGADLPMCIHSLSAYISNIGDKITPVKLPKLHILLINPNIPISSKQIYQMGIDKYSGQTNCNDEYDNIDSLIDFLKENTGNDLLNNALKIAPEIADILDILRSNKDCLYANMSGSGATCFGIFTSKETLYHAGDNISKLHNNWWVKEVGSC